MVPQIAINYSRLWLLLPSSLSFLQDLGAREARSSFSFVNRRPFICAASRSSSPPRRGWFAPACSRAVAATDAAAATSTTAEAELIAFSRRERRRANLRPHSDRTSLNNARISSALASFLSQYFSRLSRSSVRSCYSLCIPFVSLSILPAPPVAPYFFFIVLAQTAALAWPARSL